MNNSLLKVSDSLNPGYFSFVMATGIVSIAAYQQQMESTAYILFFINKVACVVLILLLVIRSCRMPGALLIDMTAPSRAPSLFTITAGICILGSQSVILSGNLSVGTLFWIVGVLFWAVLGYAFFTAMIVKDKNPVGEDELNGAWLIYVVGTQAVSILSILITPHLTRWQDGLLFEAASLHAAGSALYFILIAMIVRRMMFLSLPPEKLTPPYWINMGAAAISTLAGAELMLYGGSWSFLQGALPALAWTTLMFWAVTTSWIPLIAALNIWRYGYKRFPIAYDVQHWSMVFPLGMYAACTFQFGKATGLKPLLFISQYFVYLALAAWIVTFLGMVATALRRMK